MSALGWFLLVFVIALINTLLAAVQLWSFLARTASIDSWQSLDDFKRMARRQMYQAIVQMGLLVVACAVGVYGILAGQLSLLLVIALNGAIFGIGKALQVIEKRARSLPVSDAQLASEYQHVCETWVKKPFPDFHTRK